MKRYPTIILRMALLIAAAIVLAMGIGALIMAIKTDSTSKYHLLSYALLGGICAASIPYYLALFQAYKLLGFIDASLAFSDNSVKALSVIKNCAFAEFLICTFAGLPFFYVTADLEDAPGLIFVGMAIAGVAFIIFVFASVLIRLLQDGIAIKNENDLTI